MIKSYLFGTFTTMLVGGFVALLWGDSVPAGFALIVAGALGMIFLGERE